VRDITNRKQAEIELTAKEASLARAQRIASIGNWNWDLRTNEVNWSDETYAIFGLDKTQITPNPDLSQSFIHPDDLEWVMQAVTTSTQPNGKPYSVDYRMLKKDGSLRHVHAEGETTHDATGKAIMVFGILHDITDRVKAEQENRLHSIVLRSMKDAVVITGEDNKVIECNPAYEEISGLTRDQVIGMTGDEIWAALDFKGGSVRALEDSLDATSFWQQEFTIQRKGGGRRDIYGMAYKLYPDSPSDQTRVSILRDITNRKRAEAQLIENQASLNNAQRIAGVGSWNVDLRSNTVTWSDETFNLFGYGEERIQPSQQAALARFHPEDIPKVQAAMQASQVPGAPAYSIDHRIVKLDGTERFTHSEGEVTFSAKGEPLKMHGTIHDITERKLAQMKLQQSEQRFRDVVAASSELIWETDADGRLTYISEWVEDVTGVPVEDYHGLTVSEFQNRQIDASGTDDLEHHVQSRKPFKDQRSTLTYDGNRTIYWSTSGNPLFNEDGSFARCRERTSDITEQVQRDEQLRQAQRMEAVGQLTGGVAHDFNNILMSMQLNLEFLQPLVPLEGEGPEFIDTLTSGINRAAELTQRLLAFSRQQVLQPLAIDVNKQISSILNMLQRTLGEDIRIETAFEEQTSPVSVDPGQLESAILNLSINARHAMPKGGVLTITTQPEALTEEDLSQQSKAQPGNYLMVSVSDTGVGMSAEIIAQVFEPFFTTKDVGEGSGLGLSMVHGFDAQSNGHIAIESEVGQGTEIKMYFPQEG